MIDISDWKVLVVDDDPGIRQILTIVLELQGGQVSEASTGKEALMMLQRDPHTLVITDLDMPELNGRQLLESIRADAALAHIPVIAISGDSTARRDAHPNGVQFTAVVPKPFNARTLVDDLVVACCEGAGL